MSEYIVGIDSMYQISADTPKEAEEELARRISCGEVEVEPDEINTYEVLPNDEVS